MTIRTAADNKSTILQVAGVDKLKINDTGVVEADYFKTPSGVLSPVGSFRNKIINGDFRVVHRGNSQSDGVSGYGSADRWYFQQTSGNRDVLIGSRVPSESLSADTTARTTIYSPTTGANGRVRMFQRIEGLSTLPEGKVTISLWAQTTESLDMAVSLTRNFGTGGSPSPEELVFADRFSTTSEYQRFEFTVDIPGFADKTLGSNGGDYWQLDIWMSAGSDYDDKTLGLGHQTGTFRVAQVQVEEGPYATPFEQRPIGLETVLCERYCETLARLDLHLLTTTGADKSAIWVFKTVKRVPPAITIGNSSNAGTVTTPSIFTNFARVLANGATTGASSLVSGLIADAEL